MLRITTLLRRAREQDEGLSIVEVLVAMTVFAMNRRRCRHGHRQFPLPGSDLPLA